MPGIGVKWQNMRAKLALAVQQTNTAFATSGVLAQWCLIDAYRIDLLEP